MFRVSLPPFAVLVLLFATGACSNRLGRHHQDLLVGVPAETAPAPGPGDLSVTYLGVNGYLLRSGGTAILVDPFFSRIPLRDVVFNVPVASSPGAIALAMEKGAIPARIDGFLVTHSHFDHAFDVPALHQLLGGKVVASETGVSLCEAMGVPPAQLRRSKPGDVLRLGGAKIRVLAAQHDLVLGTLPYPGLVHEAPNPPPSRARDWRLGTPLAFLVEMGGRRVYVESGGILGAPPAVSGVDLAIVGTAVGDGKGRYAEAVRALRPRFVLPSHQDNFFNPLESGFHFSTLSDFPRIRAIHECEALPGSLRLMDYFHTWTLPGD